MREPPPPVLGERPWALFLDVDGTLLDIAPRPDLVRAPDGLLATLERLHRALDGAVALVSGRPMAELDRLLQWTGRDAAGCHGADMRIAGRTFDRPEDEALAARVAVALAEVAAAVPGALLEAKGHSVAFHYRNTDLAPASARAMVEAAIMDVSAEVRVIAGKCVVEVVPAHAGKDSAIARLLASPAYGGRLPVFAGDDVTDEDGFAFVNGCGGLSVAVGPHGSLAEYGVEDPAALRRWLAGLVPV